MSFAGEPHSEMEFRIVHSMTDGAAWRRWIRTGARYACCTALVLLMSASRLLAQEASSGYVPTSPESLFLNDMPSGPHRPHHHADDEHIETDRHDFTQSTRTVGRGVVQLEAGYSYFYKDSHEEIESSHTTPELLVRIGLTEDIEFRFRTNYVWVFRDPKDSHHEAHDSADPQDLVWGFKFQLTEHDRYIPESVLRIVSTIPIEDSKFSTRQAEIGIDAGYSWEFENGWQLAGSTGVFRNGAGEYSLVALSGLNEAESEGNFAAWAQSVALGIPMTEHSELYIEYFSIWSTGLSDNFQLGFINAGVDFLITDNLVFDIRVGKGLTGESDDFFVGVGGGIRF